MAILAKFEKQPEDIQDFDIDFSEWLAARNDTAVGPGGLVVTSDAGLTIVASTLSNGVVKIYTSGGTNGVTYKLTARVTTAGNRVKSGEVKIKVKDY